MNWRLLALAGAVTACTETGTGINGGGIADGSARVLVLTESGELVEYSAPPLVETRRFDFQSALSPHVQFVALNRDSGGFFAFEVPSGPPFGPRYWSLVRYDHSWTEVARKPVSDYIGQDTVIPEAFRLTADGRFLVGHVPVRTVAGLPPQILVLDAATLEVVRQFDGTTFFPWWSSGPEASTGPQVVLMRFVGVGSCGSAYWYDVEANLAVDSVAMPCGFVPRGFQTHRRIYVTPPSMTQYTPLMIFDADAGQIVATQSTVPIADVVADRFANRIVGIGGGGIVIMNAQNLAIQGVVVTDQDTTDLEDAVRLGVVDPVSGAFVGDLYGSFSCAGCFGAPVAVAVIDLDRREVVVQQSVGTRITVAR